MTVKNWKPILLPSKIKREVERLKDYPEEAFWRVLERLINHYKKTKRKVKR